MKKSLLPLLLGLLALTLWSCQSKEAQTTDLKVVSYNIRYDNPDDGINRWSNRLPGVNHFISETDADVMGMQEVLHNQLTDLQTAHPDYEAYGVGREDGHEAGEYCPVFWKKEKYEVLEKGYFWLSETPETPGLGWDAACERTAVWVVLRDKATLGEFLFINTHFDHRGEVARAKSVELLLSRIDELAKGRMVVLAGDFNAEPTSGVVRSLTDTSNPLALIDTREVAQQKEGTENSFHDFGEIPEEKRPLIDYVFVNHKPCTVKTHSIIGETDEPDHVYLSDHNPLVVTLSFQ